MKQNGVGSVGTLCRECMERVAFHHEGPNEVNKIHVGCNKQYYIANEHQIMGREAGFWPVINRQIDASITRLLVSRTL